MLAVFRAAIRQMSDDALKELRTRLLAVGDSPAGVTEIEREMRRRER